MLLINLFFSLCISKYLIFYNISIISFVLLALSLHWIQTYIFILLIRRTKSSFSVRRFKHRLQRYVPTHKVNENQGHALYNNAVHILPHNESVSSAVQKIPILLTSSINFGSWTYILFSTTNLTVFISLTSRSLELCLS